MSGENLVENYISNNVKNNYSEFYDNHDENDNNNNLETTITENNNTETDSNNNNNINSGNFIIKKENFIEKKNVHMIPTFFALNERQAFRIEGLKMGNVLDHYHLESLLNEFWNVENQKIFIKKSKNYLPKSKVCDVSNSMHLDLKFYYGIKVNNSLYCTYYDRYYNQYKKVYTVPSHF